jgi:hypothetical protein
LTPWQEHIGVGQPHYGLARTGNTRARKVIAEDGPRKGKVAAIETDHKSGRVDARVIVDPVRRKLSLKGETE